MDRRPRGRGRATRIGCGVLTGVVVLVVATPVWAADVAIVQGSGITIGRHGRQPVVPPGAAYTVASAVSSNPQVAQADGVDVRNGAWGVNYSVVGSGIAVVTVVWTNPTTGTARRQYFIVAPGMIVNTASTVALSIGETVTVPARSALTADSNAGDSASPSQAVAAVVHEDGVQITAQAAGTSFVYIKLAADQSGANHYVVTIVTVSKPGEPPVVD